MTSLSLSEMAAVRPNPAQSSPTSLARCRFCQAPLRLTFVDLGMSPPCESYLDAEQLNEMEPFYPLHVRVCEACFLVQLDEYIAPEAIFTEYAYFSSYSDSWLAHARQFACAAIDRFRLGPDNLIVEVGSNDGYLLKHFVARGLTVLGVEPARNVAVVAEQQGVPTLVAFFGARVARELVAAKGCAELVIANNVLAQVPDLNDFVEGLRLLLAPLGTLCVEVPHLLRLIEGNQFDTIYHEHFSYFSLGTMRRILRAHGLEVFDIDELPTHGGSLRVFARHMTDQDRPIAETVIRVEDQERAAGLSQPDGYSGFALRAAATKRALLRFLIDAREGAKTVVGYGAPGKGNTLLNYCGIRTDMLEYTVDRNPYKQGKFLPGSHVPIFHPDKLEETRPDYILILPWNIKDEIIAQLPYVRSWGCRFAVPIPSLNVE